jgi:Flp pilus assembly protein CpaB
LNKSFTILVFLALVLGAGSIFLIKKIIDVERQKALDARGVVPAAAEQIQMGDVLYVKDNLETGTPLTDMNVASRKVPASAIPDTALRTMDQIKDQFAFQPLFKDEWLLQPKVRSRDNLPKASLMIEPGKRLISIRVDEVKANSFLIKNGDFVDLVGSFNVDADNMPAANPPLGQKTTVTFLQRVKVFDIVHGSSVPNQGAEGGEAGQARMAMGTNATFEVTAQQAEIITNAETVANSMWLVLRRFDDEGIYEATSELERKIIANLVRSDQIVSKPAPPPAPVPVQQRKTVF